MKTKLVSLFVALFASTALWAYDFKSEDGLCYSYIYDDSGNVTVMVVPENDDRPAYSSLASSVSIPTSVIYNGTIYSVTSIGWYAFEGCAGLTSITIPNSVTSIGSYAFSGCTGLTSITIPNSVTTIEDRAFSGCTGLTSITIGNGVTSIGWYAFGGCTGLASIVVENGNKVYDSRNNCNAIIETETNTLIRGCNTAVIPNSVTSIGDDAFSGCTGLTSITIPNSVTSIGNEAFSGCTGLTSITIPNSVTSIEYRAFSGCMGLTSITIPNSVTSIGNEAFSGCTGLTSITIPNSVTSIEYRAFSGCMGLTSITIPNSVTSIGDDAFSDCSGLVSIVVENGNKVYDSRSNCNAIIEISTNTLIQGCKTTIIPNSVTSIGCGVFSGCTGLTSIVVENGNKVYDSRSNCNAIIETSTNTLIQGCKTTIIPNSVTSIWADAFYGCTGLTSIIIPNSVTSIGMYAFSGCTGLTSLTIPNSVMEVDEGAFYGCTGLTSVLIGNNSELSMDATFFDSKNLTQVTCYANVPPHLLVDRFYKDNLTEKTLYVPAKAVSAYKEADVWKYFGHIVPIGATATDTDEPVIMPSYTEVTIAWPTTIGAKTYTITITQEGKTISSLTFDDTGLLIDAAFAVPSDNGNARQAPAAQNTQSAFWFTFSGLECNTQYDYSIVAQSSNGQPISTYNGTFRTTAPTAIDNVSSSSSNNAATQTRKVFRNGQVLIQHNGKTYTISGNEVK